LIFLKNKVIFVMARENPVEDVVKFSLRIPSQIYDQLGRIAEDHRRSINNEIVMILETFVEGYVERQVIGAFELLQNNPNLDELTRKGASETIELIKSKGGLKAFLSSRDGTGQPH
jgi:hypothetical protein